MTERRFVFAPLERRGLIAGVRPGQAAVLAAGLVLAVGAIRAAPGPAGVTAALLVVLTATAAAFVQVEGRSVEEWAPAATRSVGRRLARRDRNRPTAHSPLAAPGCLRGLRFVSVGPPGSAPVGVALDAAQGTLTAVLAVRGRSFALLDADDKQRRLDAWATILAGLSREGCPVRAVQWVERTAPGDADALVRQYRQHRALAEEAGPCRSYAELIGTAGPLGRDHECFVALSVRGRRSDPGSARGLLREVRLLDGQLRSAELEPRVLSSRELGAALRCGFDPWARRDLARREEVGPAGTPPTVAWPASTEEAWATWRADAVWHATFWVAEWPRAEVGPDFLTPLLLQTGCQRAVSVVMAPLPPSAGIREAEAARTAQAADEALRQRAGFLATARRRRDAEGIARREAELSDGHAAYRYSGYVTVSGRSEDELEVACAETVQAAHQSRLELRRLYGAQEVAFSWTLPLGRGVANR